MSGDLKASQQRILAHLGLAGQPQSVAPGLRIDVLVPTQMTLSAGIPINAEARELVTASSVGETQLTGREYCGSRMPENLQRQNVDINERPGALGAFVGSGSRSCRAVQSKSVLL